MIHAVEYLNGIVHAYEPGPTWCARTIKDGASGTFNLLNLTFSRVLVMFVRFRFLT